MQDLISAAILIATLCGGTVAATKIHDAVREAALTKAAQGLAKLSNFGQALTRHERRLARDSQVKKVKEAEEKK